MSMLESLGIRTKGLITTSTPFSSWKGSPVQKWTITLEMLTMGDLADIARLTSGAGPLEAGYLSKVYLLAKGLKTINDQSVVTEEDIEQYNRDHNLTGMHQVDIFEYKVLFIRKWTESIVNRLVYAYDEMQDAYLAEHLGSDLPDQLKAAVMQGVNLSDTEVPSDEQPESESDGDNPPTTT